MLRFNKTPPLKLHRSTAITRFLARPVVRYGIAGFLSIFITFLLFVFMMYITQNYASRSSMASQILYDLETVNPQNQKQQRRIRVARPPVLDEAELPPGLTDIHETIKEDKKTLESSAEQPTE